MEAAGNCFFEQVEQLQSKPLFYRDETKLLMLRKLSRLSNFSVTSTTSLFVFSLTRADAESER